MGPLYLVTVSRRKQNKYIKCFGLTFSIKDPIDSIYLCKNLWTTDEKRRPKQFLGSTEQRVVQKKGVD